MPQDRPAYGGPPVQGRVQGPGALQGNDLRRGTGRRDELVPLLGLTGGGPHVASREPRLGPSDPDNDKGHTRTSGGNTRDVSNIRTTPPGGGGMPGANSAATGGD
ncbi:protein of unknown function [Streptomyces murinus]